MDIEALSSKVGDWRNCLDTARRPDPEGWTWYGYDATNLRIFSTTGLQRIVNRAGWDIVDRSNVGAKHSNPVDNRKDERCYMLLKSRVL